jgi:hypothetical protein
MLKPILFGVVAITALAVYFAIKGGYAKPGYID